MFNLYLTLLMGFFGVAYAMTGNTPVNSPSASDTEFDVLPLILIKMGRKFTNPTKIKESTSSSSQDPPIETIEFSGDSEGSQVLLCGAKPRTKTNDTEPFDPSKENYCNYPIKFKKSDSLKCAYEPEPVLTRLKIPTSPISFINNISCGQLNEGKKYQFVYQICMTEEPIENEQYSSDDFHLEVDSIKYYSEFEVYKICIKEQTMEVFYTEHRILSPRLLNDQRLKQEREITYDLRSAKNIGAREGQFEERYRLMGIQTPPLTDLNSSAGSPEILDITPTYEAQKFVPPDDFAFALWRKATFDHFNVKKMKIDQIKLWNYLGKLIRDDAIKHNREYYIHTTAYKISTPRPSDKGKSNRTKSISVWIKAIYDLYDDSQRSDDSKKNKAIAIIMDSDSENDPEVDLQLQAEFGKNLCENTFTNVTSKSVRCCSLINTKIYLSQNTVEIEEDLRIAHLYDDENQPRKKPRIDLNIAADKMVESDNDS